MKLLSYLLLGFSAGVLLADGGRNFASLPESFKGEIVVDWLKQKQPDTAEACAEQKARIKRLLSNGGLKIENASVFAEKLEKLSAEKASDELYLKLRELKRDVIFACPENGFDEIICVDAPFPRGSEAVHESRFKTENTAAFGARLLRVNPFAASKKRLAPAEGKSAAIWRSDLDFDAKKIVFQMRESDRTNYNLYTVDVDGGNLTRLTDSSYNDVDPAWLPDGNIVFCTSRANCYVRCGGSAFRTTVLARCDADGKNIYFISTNNEADFMPTVMDNGSVLYCRWEYVDKNIFRVQSLWTVNPDGTNPQVFWGGQSHYPDLKIGAYQIPETEKFIFMTSSHHNVFNSGLAVLVPSEGRNYPNGLYNLTPHLMWTEASSFGGGTSGNGPWDKNYGDFVVPACYGAFYSPFPHSKNFYLASAGYTKYESSYIQEGATRLNLYLCDYDGNMELLLSGENNIVHAQPLKTRKRPNSAVSMIEPLGEFNPNAPQPVGVLYTADVFENSGIPKEKGKYLRVIEHCAATYQDGVRDANAQGNAALSQKYNKPGWRNFLMSLGVYSKQGDTSIPRVFGFLSGETAMSVFMDESHKRILGEAEIESDGSVSIEVPSMKAVYFQILDKDRKVLQTMRSSTHVAAGENRGCLGCHATKFNAAPNVRPSLALRRPPQKLTKPFGDITFGFDRYIQPILDKNCVSCHNPTSKNKLDLTSRKMPAGGVFSAAYLNLVLGMDNKPANGMVFPRSLAGAISPYAVYKSLEEDVPTSESTIAPMQVLSGASPMIAKLERGHKNVKLSARDMAVLKAWIDLNCPYYGEEDVLEMPDVSREKFENGGIAFQGLSYLPKMRTCPDVNRAYRQDSFKTQDDRNPKDTYGNVLPAIKYDGSKRIIFNREKNEKHQN